MKAIALDPQTWDLYKDRNNRIALAPQPGAIAQSVACAARLFRGELWYNTARGVPYFERVLGKLPAPEFLRAQYIGLARTVPGVAAATCRLNPVGTSRVLTGTIEVKDAADALVGVVNVGGQLPWYTTAVIQ